MIWLCTIDAVDPTNYAHISIYVIYVVVWYRSVIRIPFKVTLLAPVPSVGLPQLLWSNRDEYWYIDGLVQDCNFYTLIREYRVVRNRYSRLLFTSEGRFCANLRVQEQLMNMTSQCHYPCSRDVTDQRWWRHNVKSENTVFSDNGKMSDRWLFVAKWCVHVIK